MRNNRPIELTRCVSEFEETHLHTKKRHPDSVHSVHYSTNSQYAVIYTTSSLPLQTDKGKENLCLFVYLPGRCCFDDRGTVVVPTGLSKYELYKHLTEAAKDMLVKLQHSYAPPLPCTAPIEPHKTYVSVYIDGALSDRNAYSPKGTKVTTAETAEKGGHGHVVCEVL